jgi:hypothetical protein
VNTTDIASNLRSVSPSAEYSLPKTCRMNPPKKIVISIAGIRSNAIGLKDRKIKYFSFFSSVLASAKSELLIED